MTQMPGQRADRDLAGLGHPFGLEQQDDLFHTALRAFPPQLSCPLDHGLRQVRAARILAHLGVERVVPSLAVGGEPPLKRTNTHVVMRTPWNLIRPCADLAQIDPKLSRRQRCLPTDDRSDEAVPKTGDLLT